MQNDTIPVAEPGRHSWVPLTRPSTFHMPTVILSGFYFAVTIAVVVQIVMNIYFRFVRLAKLVTPEAFLNLRL
jgi:hypothetical protein